jgi:Holliday junction DNA helicase RuvA
VIASLKGTVQSKTGSAAVIDVAGVGYLVSLPKGLLLQFDLGDQIFVNVTMIVREDAFQLYGFESIEQQGLFDLLRSVSGVGPKTALSIISMVSPAEISRAVTEDDSKPFEMVSGVGTKTAKLINVTLAGKIKAHAGNPVADDLLAALQSLGWSEKVAGPVVIEVCSANPGMKIPELIRACLARLSR